MQRIGDTLEITPRSGIWTASHDVQHCAGPEQIRGGADILLANCHCYVDDMLDTSVVLKRFRDYRRGGNAVVEVDGRYPFGQQIQLRQAFQYAGNHMRATVDWNWPRDTVVRRHLGVGSLKLPGQWRRMYVLPPAAHLAEGMAPAWHEIPPASTEPVMIGHWHRPPLALVFQRDNGTSVEIGTGMDLWRWQQAFGSGPESASIKVFVTAAGLELVREPLMCCQEFMPAKRQYRFSWYAAWRVGKAAAPAQVDAGEPVRLAIDPEHGLTAEAVATASATRAPMLIDFAGAWPSQWRHAASPTDFVQDIRAATPCWQSTFQKHARRVIRQLAGARQDGTVVFRGMVPNICWDPIHLQRHHGRADGMAHWDVPALLDFATWARKQLGRHWSITVEMPAPWRELPSMQQLFVPNGFED